MTICHSHESALHLIQNDNTQSRGKTAPIHTAQACRNQSRQACDVYGECLLVDLAGVRLLWNMLGFNWACDECAVNCHFEEATQGFRFL